MLKVDKINETGSPKGGAQNKCKVDRNLTENTLTRIPFKKTKLLVDDPAVEESTGPRVPAAPRMGEACHFKFASPTDLTASLAALANVL